MKEILLNKKYMDLIHLLMNPEDCKDINKENGWRRLNVLFTRAKIQIIFVTSLLPDIE